jgi:SulP family sulfate permease
MDKIIYWFGLKNKINYKTEVLSGITVALALVPSSIAFSMIAGFSPLIGLYTSFIVGIVAVLAGGRPAMITASAGAIAVIFVGLIDELKTKFPDISDESILNYVFLTVIIGGFLQLIIGVLRLGKFMRLVPHSVLFGFLNGLAIIIFTSQLRHFYNIETGELLEQKSLWIMIGFTAATMLVIWLFPKISKIVPSSLAAIIIISGIILGIGIDTQSVADTLKEGQTIKGSFPPLTIPNVPFSLDTFIIVLPYAAILAIVGLLEALLSLNIVDQMTGSRGNANKECIAQGSANFVSGFFSGMGGCTVLGQTLLNVKNKARARLSSLVAAGFILLFIMVGSEWVEMLPMAALVGLMFMVAVDTFQWSSLRVFKKMPTNDVVVMVLVTLITVITHNLALAVLIGVLIAAVAFAWENAKRIRARKYTDENGVKHYEIYGPLFFGSIQDFEVKFDIESDPDEVIINFMESRVSDMSAIETLNTLTSRYEAAGKKITLTHLSPDCRRLLKNADKIIRVNVDEDPTYPVMLSTLHNNPEE